jgi:negative regulator of flagellin synthesis FlgM
MMAEKINGQGIRPVDSGGARRTEQSEQTQGKSRSSAASSTATDTVNIERAELLLTRLEAALEVVPVADAERVRAIRDAIASGNYEVDPGVVADKIIQFNRELNI